MVDLTWLHWTGIVILGIASGFINTLAGGGSLLVIPALLFIGMDLSVVNGTNRIAILLQSIVAAAGFRKHKVLDLREALPLTVSATIGAFVGTFIAIRADGKALNLAIAALISAMAVLLIAKPRLWEEEKPRRIPAWAVYTVFFAVGIYGGFIQAGVGFFLSGALVLAGGKDLVKGNAIKPVIVGAYTIVSLAMFLAKGLVNIPVGLVLAAGSMLGAWLGARFTVAKGNTWIRWILAAAVIASAVKMVWDAVG